MWFYRSCLLNMCRGELLTSSPSRFNLGADTKARLKVRSCFGLFTLWSTTVSPERTLLTLASRRDMAEDIQGTRCVCRAVGLVSNGVLKGRSPERSARGRFGTHKTESRANWWRGGWVDAIGGEGYRKSSFGSWVEGGDGCGGESGVDRCCVPENEMTGVRPPPNRFEICGVRDP